MIHEEKKAADIWRKPGWDFKLHSQFVYVLSLPTVSEMLEGYLSGGNVRTLVVFRPSHWSKNVKSLDPLTTKNRAADHVPTLQPPGCSTLQAFGLPWYLQHPTEYPLLSPWLGFSCQPPTLTELSSAFPSPFCTPSLASSYTSVPQSTSKMFLPAPRQALEWLSQENPPVSSDLVPHILYWEQNPASGHQSHTPFLEFSQFMASRTILSHLIVISSLLRLHSKMFLFKSLYGPHHVGSISWLKEDPVTDLPGLFLHPFSHLKDGVQAYKVDCFILFAREKQGWDLSDGLYCKMWQVSSLFSCLHWTLLRALS